jgi:hypothetical protein
VFLFVRVLEWEVNKKWKLEGEKKDGQDLLLQESTPLVLWHMDFAVYAF